MTVDVLKSAFNKARKNGWTVGWVVWPAARWGWQLIQSAIRKFEE
jgi:hypothetical protein